MRRFSTATASTARCPISPHLDDFIGTRDVGFGLWFVGMAQVNQEFAADLEKVMTSVHQRLDRVL